MFLGKLKQKIDKQDNDINVSKFILGLPNQSTKFPYDISELSYDDLIKIGFKPVTSHEFQINQFGQPEAKGDFNISFRKEIEKILKQDIEEDSGEDISDVDENNKK